MFNFFNRKKKFEKKYEILFTKENGEVILTISDKKEVNTMGGLLFTQNNETLISKEKELEYFLKEEGYVYHETKDKIKKYINFETGEVAYYFVQGFMIINIFLDKTTLDQATRIRKDLYSIVKTMNN